MADDRGIPATKGDLEDAVAQIRSATSHQLEDAVAQVRSQTKGDLEDAVAQVRSQTKGDLEDAVAQIRSEASHQYDDLKEAIRDSETRLLQAFYGFAETNHKRMAQYDATTALLMSRVSTIENRLIEVEKRLNIPPAQ